jgi:subtilase family serine protease
LPNIAYFRINPETINPGECALLEWGAVTNAFEAIIDQGIGGVATPGGMEVCPTETTSYVLTANGLGGTVTSTVTITVSITAPNLSIESITFKPDPPVQGQDNEVRIAIRNTGGVDAGPFSWEWQPGTETPIGGRLLDGLEAGQSRVQTAVWRPGDAYDRLLTVARVDIGNEIAETNESDNELQANTEVAQASLGDLVLQEFYLHSDDLVVIRISNPGGRITAPTFEYQLFQDGSLAASGSFAVPAADSMDFWTDFVVAGEHSIRVVIDPENLVAESDESNNDGTLTCSSSSRSCW